MDGSRVPALGLALGLGAMLGTDAPAAELTLLRSFAAEGPSGLAYDRALCGLWIANETGTVLLVNLWGEELRRLETGLARVDAIAMEGDHLLLSDGSGQYQRIDRDGADLAPPFRLPIALEDADGLYVDEASSEIWIADDTEGVVARIGSDGGIVWMLDGSALVPPLSEPQGLTRDPATGHLLVVDDADGSDSLFEFAADGTLLDVVPLADGDMRDAEGISLDPDSSTLFVAFDAGDRVAVYRYTPSRGASGPAPAGAGRCVISGFPSGDPPV